MILTARPLPSTALSEVIDVMADAFTDYPLMPFVVGPEADVVRRHRRLVELFVTRRLRRGGPMIGVLEPGSARLAGAAILTLPQEPDPPIDLAEWVEAVWRDLGVDAHERYQRYAATWPVLEERPHHHLNMLGVRRAHAGRGLARPILEAVHELAAVDPESSGVSLTTEVARNVTFYEHFGYRQVGHKQVAPNLESWGFFRPH